MLLAAAEETKGARGERLESFLAMPPRTVLLLVDNASTSIDDNMSAETIYSTYTFIMNTASIQVA